MPVKRLHNKGFFPHFSTRYPLPEKPRQKRAVIQGQRRISLIARLRNLGVGSCECCVCKLIVTTYIGHRANWQLQHTHHLNDVSSEARKSMSRYIQGEHGGRWLHFVDCISFKFHTTLKLLPNLLLPKHNRADSGTTKLLSTNVTSDPHGHPDGIVARVVLLKVHPCF